MKDVTETGSAAPESAEPAAQGWYFYGITARDDQLAVQVKRVHGMARGGALEVIEQDMVAALVQPVPLDEFGPAALAAHVEDMAWIEAAARRHHEAIVALHQQRALLPARFGAVYPTPEALRDVLAETRDALRAHLARVEGCEEWDVRLFSDRTALFRCLEATYPELVALRAEMEAATPGRAYLLRRKLDDAQARAAEETLRALAEEAYEHLARHARASQVNPHAQSAQHARDSGAAIGEEAAGEDEVLRADFLVPRAGVDAFTRAMEVFVAAHEGTRWTCSGPWPIYSFAVPLTPQSEVDAKEGTL